MTGQMLLAIENHNEIPAPSWDDVSRALRQLDGHTVTQVSLETVEEVSLLAGGGNDGRYIVSFIPMNDLSNRSYTLADPRQTGADVTLTSQVSAMYPARYAVQFAELFSAFRYFFEHPGKRDPELFWEED